MNEDEKPNPSLPQGTIPNVVTLAEQGPDSMDVEPNPLLGAATEPTARIGSGAADVHSYIGRQLRAVFDDVAKQPVPQRFLDLMQQIEERTSGR